MSVEEDLELIVNQERVLQYTAFNENDGWELGCRLREICVSRSLPLVVDVRRTGQQLFFSALPGSTPDNIDWARRKANTVARFHRSSYGMGLELQSKGVTLADRFGLMLNDFAAHGGSFPLTVAGSGVVGSVTVSGLPQRQDHELVVETLCSVLKQSYGSLRLP